MFCFVFPIAFGWKRCLFRTSLLLLVAFIGETFPNFGQILDLIGGSSISMMAFVFPPIFYAKLCHDRSNHEWPIRSIPFHMYFVYGIIVISGIVGGIASTYSTLKNWSGIEASCYGSGQFNHFNRTNHHI